MEITDSIDYINDAEVEVNGVPFFAIPFNKIDASTAHNWVTSDLNLLCGQICSLKIEYKDQLIEGITKIPGSIGPVEVNGATIHWQGDSLNVYYDITIQGLWSERPFIGSSYNAREKVPVYQPGVYKIIITAYDKNYSLALHNIKSNMIGDSLSIGVEGAYGVFGSGCVWEGELKLE